MFWFTVSNIISSKLKTEEKQQRMTPSQVDKYNDQISESGITRIPAMSAIDVHGLTASCGAKCTEDGIHYQTAVYDATMQVKFFWVVPFPSVRG